MVAVGLAAPPFPGIPEPHACRFAVAEGRAARFLDAPAQRVAVFDRYGAGYRRQRGVGVGEILTGCCSDAEGDAERFHVVHHGCGTSEVFAGSISRRADGEQEHAGKDCGCGCHGAEQAVDAVPAGMSGRCGGRQDAVAQVVGSAGITAGRDCIEGCGCGPEFGGAVRTMFQVVLFFVRKVAAVEQFDDSVAEFGTVHGCGFYRFNVFLSFAMPPPKRDLTVETGHRSTSAISVKRSDA